MFTRPCEFSLEMPTRLYCQILEIKRAYGKVDVLLALIMVLIIKLWPIYGNIVQCWFLVKSVIYLVIAHIGSIIAQ